MVFSAAALLVVFVFFVWLNLPVVMGGLSNTDDAEFAVDAKSIAIGKGYGIPRSSETLSLFDPEMSTGPALMLPIALLTWAFGSIDRLPGAATLLIFVGQLIIAAILLSHRFGWAPTCGFLFALMLFLMLASGGVAFADQISLHNWWFGLFLGEPPAFGFTLTGTALLAVSRGERGIAAAGLCFSLAFLTKQIALFAVAGIIGAWLVVSTCERVPLTVVVRRLAILMLVGLSLPLAFEGLKLATLGLDRYQDLWRKTLEVTAAYAIGVGDQSARMARFLTIISQFSVSPVLAMGLAIASLLMLVLFIRSRDEGRNIAGRFAAFAWAGAAVYLAYILVVSMLWERYFWIGVAVTCTAISAPMLAMRSNARITTIMGLLVGTLLFGLYQPLYSLHDQVSATASIRQRERAAILELLDKHSALPFAAEHLVSIADVLFLKADEGKWASEPHVRSLRDREFIAVIHHQFTDSHSSFFKSVTATCEPLTQGTRIVAAYRCSHPFWSMYR